MRTLVKRALLIPHGGMFYVDQPAGQPAVVWLDEAVFTAADAAHIHHELNGPGREAATGRFGS